MHHRGFDIACRGGTHYEAAICSLIQTHTSVGLMHVRHNLFGVEEHNQVLREEPEGVHYRIFLREPDCPSFGNAKLRPRHPGIYICKFVRIENRLCAPRTRNLGNGGTNHLSFWMERRQFFLGLRSASYLVCGAAGFLQTPP